MRTPIMRQRLQATATRRSPGCAQKAQAGHRQLRKGQLARDDEPWDLRARSFQASHGNKLVMFLTVSLYTHRST
jgi:hypothetical protein